MPTWIWNKSLRQWWNSSTNGEIDNIYRWSNRALTSQQVARYLDRYRKSFKVESCGKLQACSNDQDLFPGWMRKSWRFRDSPRWLQPRAMTRVCSTAKNAPPQYAEILLGEPDLFLQRKPSSSPEDGISLHIIVNLHWPNRVATIGFRCCTQNSLGFPERRFNQRTSSRKNLRHKGFLTPLGNWAGRETLRNSVCTALAKASNSPIRDSTKDYFL